MQLGNLFLKTQSHASCILPSVQFSSVAQSSTTLSDPRDCSTPGLPVHHQLPEFTQTHAYWVGDAIHDQPSHSLSSPSPAFYHSSGSFPMTQFFTSGGQNIGVSASASVLPMNIQDWFPLGWTGCISLLSKGLSRAFSNTQFRAWYSSNPASCFVRATGETRRWSWAFTELEWARSSHDLRIYYTDVLIKTLISLGPFRIPGEVHRAALGFPDFPGLKSLRV